MIECESDCKGGQIESERTTDEGSPTSINHRRVY